MSDFDTLIAGAFGDKGYYGEGHDVERDLSYFLGMLIESFDLNLQWQDGATCDITLYEDYCGDAGRSPAVFGGARQVVVNNREYTVVDTPLYNIEDMIGSPYRFSMGQFEFCGILQSINKSDGQDGKQEWKVQLAAPNKSPGNLISRIHLVISGYYNDLGLDNIFNIGKIVEDQKSSMVQSYQWWNQWLQDEYENYLGLPHTLLPAQTNTGNAEVIRQLALQQGWNGIMDLEALGILNMLSHFVDRNVYNGTRNVWVDDLTLECAVDILEDRCRNVECPTGYHCVNGVCVCDGSNHCDWITCPPGYTCENGTCIQPPKPSFPEDNITACGFGDKWVWQPEGMWEYVHFPVPVCTPPEVWHDAPICDCADPEMLIYWNDPNGTSTNTWNTQIGNWNEMAAGWE